MIWADFHDLIQWVNACPSPSSQLSLHIHSDEAGILCVSIDPERVWFLPPCMQFANCPRGIRSSNLSISASDSLPRPFFGSLACFSFGCELASHTHTSRYLMNARPRWGNKTIFCTLLLLWGQDGQPHGTLIRPNNWLIVDRSIELIPISSSMAFKL